MRFSKAAFRLRNWRSPEARRLNYLEYVLANDEHAKEVKLFGLGPLFLGRYRSSASASTTRTASSPCGAPRWGYALSLLATARLLRLLRAHGARRGARARSRSAT